MTHVHAAVEKNTKNAVEESRNGIINADMKQLALLTLYTDYQIQQLHIEEMFYAADVMGHADEMMSFCWDSFLSDSTDRNNPEGSLGWSNGFIPYGIRMILLYLYENFLQSKAAAGIASYVVFKGGSSISQ